MNASKPLSIAVMFIMIVSAALIAMPGAYAEGTAADGSGDIGADTGEGTDRETDDDETSGLDTEDLIDPVIRKETITNPDSTVTAVVSAEGTDEDGNTVYLEMRTTELLDGNGTLIVESEKETDADGNVIEEEITVTLVTDLGEFQIEIENDIDDDSGEPVSELEIEMESEDDVALTPENIQTMIDRIDIIAKYVPGLKDELRNFVKVLAGADGTLEVTPEAFKKLIESGTGFEISTKDGVIELDSDVCTSMSNMTQDVKVSMKQNDRTGLTPEQLETIGDKTFITLDAESADGKIHELNGKANVTLSDMSLAGKKIVYVDENGNTEPVETQTVQGQLSFTTNHFSVFMAVDDSDGTSDPLPIIAVGAVIAIAVAGIAIYALRRH